MHPNPPFVTIAACHWSKAVEFSPAANPLYTYIISVSKSWGSRESTCPLMSEDLTCEITFDTMAAACCCEEVKPRTKPQGMENNLDGVVLSSTGRATKRLVEGLLGLIPTPAHEKWREGRTPYMWRWLLTFPSRSDTMCRSVWSSIAAAIV